jgi:hypothetical protein
MSHRCPAVMQHLKDAHFNIISFTIMNKRFITLSSWIHEKLEKGKFSIELQSYTHFQLPDSKKFLCFNALLQRNGHLCFSFTLTWVAYTQYLGINLASMHSTFKNPPPPATTLQT